MSDFADLPVPVIVLTAGADGVDASVPVIALDTGADGGWVVPAVTLEVEQELQYNALGEVVPAPDLAGTLLTGPGGTAALEVPAAEITIDDGHDLVETVPAIEVAATGLTGFVGAAALATPATTLEAVGYHNPVGTGDNPVAAVLLSAYALSEQLGTIAAITPTPRLTANGYAGTVASADLTVPVLALEALGYGPYVGTVEMTAPAPYLDAVGLAAVASSFQTWALNIRKKALTEYDSFEFNSYAVFRDVVLAAGPEGLFKLTGENLDAAAEIDAVVRTGEENFGTSFNKRIPRLYVGYESVGNLHFSTFTSQDGKRTYLLPTNNIPGIQQRRVPFGRKPKSANWQFEIANVAGCDFLISNLQAYPEKGSRRVV